MHTPQVLSECYADTVLIQLLVPEPLVVVHIYGIPNVAKELKEAELEQKMGVRIGVVDNDKRSPTYLSAFDTVLEQHNVCLKRRGESNHYLLVINKAIETFLLWNAAEVAIDLVNYGFPTEVKLLGKSLKTTAIGSDPDYLRLLTDLHARNAPGFLTLHQLLNDLITT